jgi:hypothetical protein
MPTPAPVSVVRNTSLIMVLLIKLNQLFKN